MKVHISIPFRADKNLGRAYNEAFEQIGADDWACFMDIDTLFLTPQQPLQLEKYAKDNENAGILTCYTNRISNLAFEQLLGGKSNEDDRIRRHIELARSIENNYGVSPIVRGELSGYLMLISKKAWLQCPCPEYLEKGGSIGVDTMWSRAMRRSGRPLMRMNSIYIWHTYRIEKGIHDKEHLK